MRTDITRLDLRLRRRGIWGFTLGLAGYTLVIVALYPSFKNQTSLDALTANGNTLGALLGASGSLTSPVGWVNANLYANFLPLFVLVITIGYGADAIAGQDEANTLSLVAALPLSRRDLVSQKMTALLLMALPATTATVACVFAGRAFQLPLGIWPVLSTTLGVLLLGAAFGLLALAVGAATGSRGTAIAVAGSAATGSYILSALAPAVNWVHPLRFASLFYYSVGNHQLDHGLCWAAATVLCGTCAALAVVCVAAFARLDLH
ncbi:MAG TPA: ABC transporter permease subunit [Nocardioides sp.]|jgi:ABC-2 type transport system permease protein|uniref:ABC transporter permease subunit n=1 Tax=Nocardioides sp. TaxID=35761 RepID=UPI002E33980B|nr:ABC transporter permease subunit [Nocardioides sp.]HEX3929402.1 ABC transporter permease subunit [Nocardioides sp.]